ncbi:hypothetical protein DSCA_46680 [Desulfosarcina alkanivorans]|uniref:Uncharacterized protein n=1 Tax=Desulfosarcina alkanivorans TaxID=571177 RepID=A0A5K7YPU4_9BACT|nr:hypothetical protein [Desulfosarcina alkanivorans]BBO70738.1 hypothetical protein DSCA_46680 [Desulfosarcina alkanivorans]
MRTITGAGLILVAVLVSHARGDLTGRWSGNDGGTYYLRQTGSRVYWFGESTEVKPAWSNVFSGQASGNRIKGHWADVPKGRAAGSGTLELEIGKEGNALRIIKKTGGFVGSRWTRLAGQAAGSRPLPPLKPSGKDGCTRFNPATASVQYVNGRWKIVDGGRWLFDFGRGETEARRAMKVIRHYRFDRSCVVGRPQASFTYMLAKGGSPSGAMAGENCVAFDPGTLKVSKIQGRWKILSGRRWLFDFVRSETEARRALSVIRRYGFSHSCFVGRPNAGFTYLRR